MNNTRKENLDAFLKVLDVDDATTGGGSASCIAGSMAAGMAGMVARLSKGKKLGPDEHYDGMVKEFKALQQALFDGGALDSRAFDQVSRAFKMPKQTPEEKAERSRVIQAGYEACARVPMDNGKNCLRVMTLCRELKTAFNANCASDLDCALMLAEAGVRGCLANVVINLPGIKDPSLVRELTDQCNTIKEELK